MEQIQDPLLEAGGPAVHWIGPEMLVDLTIEGRNVNALVDSGSQVNTITPAFMQHYGFPVLPLEDLVDHPLNLVNTITPAFMQHYGFPVLPLEDLVDHPLNLVGLGGKHTSPLGFIILHMQVWEITGCDEDIVFLVIPDESKFGHRVPLVIGTCTIGQIINIIWESEIDHLSMP